jgi:hypothetical protein
MGYLGYKPADKPLTAADITDSIITSAKIVDATITNSDVASSIITGQTAETSIAGGDSVLIYDDSASALRKMTRTNFVSGIGGVNTPAFEAEFGSTQSISNGTDTKANFNTEILDTASCYDPTTNYRFTPNVSGKYFIYAQLAIFGGGNTTLQYAYTKIFKNGSSVSSAHFDLRANEQAFSTPHTTAIVTLNGSTDYVECYALAGSTGSPTLYTTHAKFGGFKLIE